MAAAHKKRAITQVSESSVPKTPPYQLVGASHDAFGPSASPARALQAELVNRLQNEQSPRRKIVTDMIAGTFAASCFIGLTFIAIV